MAGKIELVLTAEFKEAYKKLPQDIKKKVTLSAGQPDTPFTSDSQAQRRMGILC